MALALVEAGARAVYCLDLPKTPGEEWEKVSEYVRRMKGKTGGEGEGRLEYVCADVTDQVRSVLVLVWDLELGGGEGEKNEGGGHRGLTRD